MRLYFQRLELVKQDNYYAYASLAALFYQVAALIDQGSDGPFIDQP